MPGNDVFVNTDVRLPRGGGGGGGGTGVKTVFGSVCGNLQYI